MTRASDGWRDFPRQHARTRRFSLGEPRGFSVAPDGGRVVFLRAPAGDDPVHGLWLLDLSDGTERCVVDPRQLDVDDAALPPEERARRERAREQGAGVVTYTTDRPVRLVCFTLGGRLFVAELDTGTVRDLDVDGPVVSPVLDPTGTRIAFVRHGALHVVSVDGTDERVLAEEPAEDVTWGLAEFIAAEEMGRSRGLWWSHDGDGLLAARVDVSPVPRWHVTDPAEPAGEPTVLSYPAAGTANADVSLHLVDLDGDRTQVRWDAEALPYLAAVSWRAAGPLVTVQSRDQRTLRTFAVDPATGETTLLDEQVDEHWVDLVPGLPRRLDDGRLLTAFSGEDTRRLACDGVPLTPAGMQVRRLVAVDEDRAVVTASLEDPTAVGLWAVPLDGADPQPLTDGDGVHDGAADGGVTVIVARSLDTDGARVEIRHGERTTAIASHAETSVLTPRVELLRLGARGLAAALLLPAEHDPASGPLPVLLDPYGGPHAQRVLQARAAFGTSQWFADAGYAVLVVDGRGSPGRGLAWERTLAGDLATAPLTDQIDALHALAEQRPRLVDLDRVAIRGWSFGGYLAALAVLRRPDVVHAAVAGAPVTDWSLYDTHYTERYLGTPHDQPEAYRTSSLLDDAASPPMPDVPARPLLLIHGLADDNVVAAHTLRLSRALLEAGRPHQVLPLVGVTHMTPQEAVAENLLHLQLRFLDAALARD